MRNKKCFVVEDNARRTGMWIRLGDYTVSIQIGGYSYSDEGKTTAEVAVVTDDGLLAIDDGATVHGHATPEQVARLIAIVAAGGRPEEIERKANAIWNHEEGDHDQW